MSGRVVLNIQSQAEGEWLYIQYNTNIQSQAEGEWLYIQYNTDVNVVNNL